MSGLDKFFASFGGSSSASDEKRAEARAKARSVAGQGDWLSVVLDQHQAIDRAFSAVRSAVEPASRRAAEKNLATLLTGHSIAEEAVIYPALAQIGEKGHAQAAYDEQAAAKLDMALLETLDPMSQDYIDKLNHLESEIRHHVFEEESKWFLELLNKATPDQNRRIATRFKEEFGRYMGEGQRAPEGLRAEPPEVAPPSEPRSFRPEPPERDLGF